MITSKDVFAKRKAGQLDQAYKMALELVAANASDEWNFKALAWCLIDLIKRDATSNHHNLTYYSQQLQSIEVASSDEILTTQVQYALSLCNPNGQLIQRAKTLSIQGQHLQAANIYKQLCSTGAGDLSVQTSLGWELFRLLQSSLSQEHINVSSSKRLLADYLKLHLVEKPSLLHSSVLQQATKLAGNSSFSLISFCRYWQLDYLREEDYEPYIGKNGEQYSSLAEKVIQQASKESIASDNVETLQYITPYLDNAIKHFPDNIWLKLNKAKLLLKMGRNQDAFLFATDVTRSKSNDYWSWALLGEVNSGFDKAIELSCYCKALLCHTDDKFTAKVRIKMAKALASQGDFAEAKHEVDKVIASKRKDGLKVPKEIEKLQAQEWYKTFIATESNKKFYQSNVSKAEELLFSDLPFVKACIGEKFTISDKPNKAKRKLYLIPQGKREPIEISIPDNKYRFGDVGAGLSIKGDFDANGRYQVFLITHRDYDVNWDIFTDHIAVVDNVNHKKGMFHIIVDRQINSVVHFSDIDFSVKEGDFLAVKVAQFKTKQAVRYRVLSVKQTDKKPSSLVCKFFTCSVRESNGMGFTDDNIFVAPPLMAKHNIGDGMMVEGMAVLNYNKKKMSWGWKALKLTNVRSIN
ncbi:tetratricopeptide repeat protein [Vibrio parahaemolyticus]|nr:tetratricopeptide repeat protein [Vibrio parahaemolyticus]EGR2744349.1 tetratricopeptide repeat protein [Vibrio parahaemolyticus]EGR2875200.1 tetratricopeptide repeat protein [Vibrio parahaemolyticus]EJC7065374.1 tetratricopeptide repeat protein [Vibrio parahaemolyticus]EJG0502476.1 tetratricopeptide repeat protein [Vibrio parahaemolyticus]